MLLRWYLADCGFGPVLVHYDDDNMGSWEVTFNTRNEMLVLSIAFKLSPLSAWSYAKTGADSMLERGAPVGDQMN